MGAFPFVARDGSVSFTLLALACTSKPEHRHDGGAGSCSHILVSDSDRVRKAIFGVLKVEAHGPSLIFPVVGKVDSVRVEDCNEKVRLLFMDRIRVATAVSEKRRAPERERGGAQMVEKVRLREAGTRIRSMKSRRTFSLQTSTR